MKEEINFSINQRIFSKYSYPDFSPIALLILSAHKQLWGEESSLIICVLKKKSSLSDSDTLINKETALQKVMAVLFYLCEFLLVKRLFCFKINSGCRGLLPGS